MKYFYAELENGIECLYSSELEIKKGNVVVVPPMYDEEVLPMVARVTKILSELAALTNASEPIEIIQLVDMNEYISKKKKEKENAVLLSKMQAMASEITLIDKMKKHAGNNPEMAKLLQQYEATRGSNEEVEDSEC